QSAAGPYRGAMSITKETPVGTIAAQFPLATRVFARHQIDFCCGGGLALEAACEKRQVDVAAVLDELQSAIQGPADPDLARWDTAPLPELIDHLLTAFHAPQREELDRILAMTEKVCSVHGDKDPARFADLLHTVRNMHADLEQHFLKEEQILFPTILEGNGAMAALGPIPVMEGEHEAVGEMLRTLRHLTNDYTVPEGACNTWTALWHALADIERTLHMHIHLENNVLHERVRSGS
ncbi:MAG: iron-sulfur cluster repair di-iron protein, partial [Planctomycetes bacterium]|nr:iron-sulfur cluster repair di-iron protein [Planctomycetota bacterium]